MKRKLILTITIAALLCILFAFTVSASNYISFDNYSFNASKCWFTSVTDNVGDNFGILYYYDDTGYETAGFYNVEYWHTILSDYSITDSDSFIAALNGLAANGIIREDFSVLGCGTYFASTLAPLYLKYVEQVSLSNSYHDGYDDGYNIGKTEGYQSGYVKGANDTYENAYNDGYNEGTYDGYSDGYYDGETDTYDAAADYVENWFTLQGLKQYIVADETLPSKDIFEYEFNHNSVAFKEATYSAGETDGLNASGIAKEGILSIVSAPFYFFSGIFNFEIFGVNLFSIISVILTLAVVAFFFKKIKG